ncbi:MULTISPECIES: acyl-CoA thioesterase [Amycolatopsis]|uniref:Acyl-CoA thioesterase n=1 Tax=Amycolatopsis albidoflavus TaxID=102226 RepID=A0ABW5I3R3_9PSEU
MSTSSSAPCARTLVQRTLTHLAQPADLNHQGDVAGAVIFRLIDHAAWLATLEYSNGPTATRAVKRLEFLNPVREGGLLHACAQIERVNNTSIEVRTTVTATYWSGWADDPEDLAAPPTPVASAELVFVAIDVTGTPRAATPVPGTRPSSENLYLHQAAASGYRRASP